MLLMAETPTLTAESSGFWDDTIERGVPNDRYLEVFGT